LTRRCLERRYLLRPSELTNRILLYCLALAAAKTGVRVHAFVAMSSHLHLVVTDPDARLPEFCWWLHALSARALNASRGRWAPVWGPGSYSAVRLESSASTLEKLVYLLGNPVEAGLVRHAHTWPGLWSKPRHIGGEPLVVRRPPVLFDPEGNLPDELELALRVPPGFEGLGAGAFAALVEEQLLRRENELAAAIAADGRSFLGVKGVLAQDWNATPTSVEPRRDRNPRLAERNKWLRIEAIKRLVAFWNDHRHARLAFEAGDRSIAFPQGTYLHRVRYAVAVLAPS
jgi:REP element-mobilizing transposase RayT